MGPIAFRKRIPAFILPIAGVKKLAVPNDYILGRALATNIVDKTTGEVLAKANDEITEELLLKLQEAGVASIETIWAWG